VPHHSHIPLFILFYPSLFYSYLLAYSIEFVATFFLLFSTIRSKLLNKKERRTLLPGLKCSCTLKIVFIQYS
jgi:hypothetical protein